MKLKPNLFFIEDAFEIRLSSAHWLKIQRYAHKHQITYSWVTRLCLFRFLKKNYFWNQKLKARSKKVRKFGQAEKIHRHMLCLYGNDAITIRLRAAKLGITITQLVRLAVELYLPLLDRKISSESLVKLGTKLISTVMEKLHKYKKIVFKPGEYWPLKPGPVKYLNYDVGNWLYNGPEFAK